MVTNFVSTHNGASLISSLYLENSNLFTKISTSENNQNIKSETKATNLT